MTRHIVVDATPYGPGPSGARRRCTELLQKLAPLCDDDVFEVHWAADAGPPPAALQLDNVVHVDVPVSHRGGWRRLRARARQLKQRHSHAAYTHLLVDYAPVPRLRGVRTLISVHDLRFLHGHASRLRALYGHLRYGTLLRRAAVVVCVAPTLEQECLERYRLPASSVSTVPNAVGTAFVPPASGASRAGLLVVARDHPYKARGAAEAVAATAGEHLQIVEGGLDEEALVAAYQQAKWLLAPSLYEGFHMPVIEALACGTPVIASDIAAHRDLETLGARGLVRVALPRRSGAAWAWPEAIGALQAAPPQVVAAPAYTWADAATAFAALL